MKTDRTKLLQILLLLGAGVLSGTLVTRMWLRPHHPAGPAARVPAAMNVPERVVTSSAGLPSATETPRPAPVVSAAPKVHTSDIPSRTAARKWSSFRRFKPVGKPAPVSLATMKPEPAVAPSPTGTPPPASVATPPPEAAQTGPRQPSPHQVTLYTGLLIPVRLMEGLSSEKNQPGDTFRATIDQEIVVDGFVIVERGALVEGRVTAVDRASARLTVELTRLNTADRQKVAIQTESFERRTGTPPPASESEMRGMRSAPATLPPDTRIRFRLRTSILLTEKLG